VVWSVILGWLLWREQLGQTIWIGATVIVLAGFYLIR
jgi:drug/metabolite transporter (DMT)-like permease